MTEVNSLRREEDIYVVAGGGGALGLEVCRNLTNAGHVIIVDIGHAAAKAAELLQLDGLDVTYTVCDVSNAADTAALREFTLSKFGKIDAVINLAGVARNDRLVNVVDAEFDLTMASHARGTMNMMRTFAPVMQKRKYGRIINTSSVVALGASHATSYSAAKGAIEAMTRTAAVELAKYGITVNCVAPGVVSGGMFQQQPEIARDHMIERTPMRRAGYPSEIAACYRFLSSREASFVTGQILYVCGGASIGVFN